jgi:hypothetical protein
MMLSRVYQLSSEPSAQNYALDPDNILLWRMSQRRLDAEALRDAILATSGRLDLGHPPASLNEKSSNDQKGAIFQRYRTVYLPTGRDAVGGFRTTFDFAEPSAPAGQRNVTTVPAQALFFMNNFFVSQHAKFLAERVAAIADSESRIEQVFKLAYGRPPADAERQSARKFFQTIDESSQAQGDRRYDAWPLFCQAIYAGAEFRYLR